MNTKNGKCGVFAALTAALLVTAALITSCAPEEVIVYRDGYQPPEGYGFIRINLPEFTGRTALPVAGAWTSFALSIQPYTTNTSGTGTTTGTVITKTVAATDLNVPINLTPGFYELTATASIGIGQEAARGTSARFTITAGAGIPVTVPIKPLPYTEVANGTFEYTLTFTGITGATAAMTITALEAGGPSGYAAETVTAGTDTVTLKPGSYSVFLEATANSGNTASITEIVNIHQNLKSLAGFDFNGDYFTAFISSIIPNFSADDVKPILERSGSIAIADGATITLSGTNSTTITITNDDKFTAITWYCGGSTPRTVTGDNFTITAGTNPFGDPITYPVTVVGRTADGLYSTRFKVQITD